MLFNAIWKKLVKASVLQTPEQIAAARDPHLAEDERVALILKAQNTGDLVDAIVNGDLPLPWMRLQATRGNVDSGGPGMARYSMVSLYGTVVLGCNDDGDGEPQYVQLNVADKSCELTEEQKERLMHYSFGRIDARTVMPVDYV